MADGQDKEDKRLKSFRETTRKIRSATPGSRFGKLTIVKPVTRNGVSYRECLCDCGKTAVVKPFHLMEGHTTSCGCRVGVKVGTDVKAAAARRQADARGKAAVHTDVIVGSLVEILSASPADILPNHPILAKAKENGVDHLIKKISIIPVRIGTRERKNKDGSITLSPIIRERVDLEMYSRLDAAQQLRDNFGMKQEPRANQFEETKRQEVEREIQSIMTADGCDELTACQALKDNIGDAPHLVTVIDKIMKKQRVKTESVH